MQTRYSKICLLEEILILSKDLDTNIGWNNSFKDFRRA